MKIVYKDIILRDYQESDIENDIRWMTVETAWHDWDAPWKAEKAFREFNPAKFRQRMMDRLAKGPDENGFRYTFEIETKEGVHIGGVNTYFLDRQYKWKPRDEGGCLHTLGIGIHESAYWHKGLGTQALTAFIKYYIDHGITDLYTETWSGNYPMVALAEKLGFEVCLREKDYRRFEGELYDGLTFKLNIRKFKEFLQRT